MSATMTLNLSGRTNKGLPRVRRAQPHELPGFRLMARDRQIIRAVYEFRALTTPQIERLFFPEGSLATAEVKSDAPLRLLNHRCQHRLKLLFHHGYLHREERPQKRTEGSKPLVYYLDMMGAELLSREDEAELDWDPTEADVSSPFLEHLLLTNDLRIAVIVASRNLDVAVRAWIDDRALKSPHMKDYVTLTGSSGGTRQVAVVPDGYFLLNANRRSYHHFLEIDRGTVTAAYSKDGKRDWSHKVRAYNEYLASGKYEARYKTKTVRILTVTTGEKRMAHLKQITEATAGETAFRFWFTTFDQISPETILTTPIWHIAGSDERRPLLI